MDLYKILAIASPFVSASLAALLAYYLTLKTKKINTLYENKVPAFWPLSRELINLGTCCINKVSIPREMNMALENGKAVRLNTRTKSGRYTGKIISSFQHQ